jgi:hypothetical protein
MAMSEAISAFCQVFGLDDVPSGSSPQSRLRALGGHVRIRLREALHHGVRRAFAVLASHYDVDLERVSEGYCLPDEDEAALAEVQRLDVAVAGPSAVLKGKCALGPFLSILVIECQHKWSCVNLCQMMDKVKINIKVCF